MEFNASIVNTHAVAAMLPQKARIELSLVSSSRAKLDVSVGMLKVLYAAYTFYSKKHCWPMLICLGCSAAKVY